MKVRAGFSRKRALASGSPPISHDGRATDPQGPKAAATPEHGMCGPEWEWLGPPSSGLKQQQTLRALAGTVNGRGTQMSDAAP